MELIEVNFNDEGDIIDTLSGKILKDTPEERVRQRFINILQSDYGYPKNIIAREVPVQQGSKILSSDDGAEIRAAFWYLYYSIFHSALQEKCILSLFGCSEKSTLLFSPYFKYLVRGL